MSLSGYGSMVALLARRAPLLRELRRSPAAKSDLLSPLDVSRSTIDRAIRELERDDLVERIDGRYRLTLAGRIALDAFDEFSERLEAVQSNADVLDCLPSDVSLSAELLVDAETVRAKPAVPQRPVEALAATVARAERIRGTVVGIAAQFVDIYRRQILDGATVEVVTDGDTLSRLLGRYSDAIEEVLETGRVEIREAPSTPPYGLKIHESGDERIVTVAVYGENGVRALIRNDTSEAVRWAERRYEELRASSEPVPTS